MDGLRGDIVTNRAARALAALERRTEVTEEDVRRVTVLCLQHRLRKVGVFIGNRWFWAGFRRFLLGFEWTFGPFRWQDVVSDTLDNTALVVKVLLQEFGKGPPPIRPVMRLLEPHGQQRFMALGLAPEARGRLRAP